MQRKTKKTVGRVIGVVAVVLVAVVVIGRWSSRSPEVDVAAYERGAGRQDVIAGLVHVLERELDLTSEQRAQVDEFLETWGPRWAELAASADTGRSAILEALWGEPPDVDRLHALVDRQVDTLATAGHDLTDDVVAVARTLTAEQRAVIQAHWEQRSHGTRGRWVCWRRR